MEDKRKDQLPLNFRKLLLVQLRKLVSQGKSAKIENSFKVPAAEKPAKPAAPSKKPAVAGRASVKMKLKMKKNRC
uniref:H15 domain-containing protein n=1 Tax=Nymphaea colorata TaxID=210225 RepID=A0A5K1CC16_9MAGN